MALIFYMRLAHAHLLRMRLSQKAYHQLSLTSRNPLRPHHVTCNVGHIPSDGGTQSLKLLVKSDRLFLTKVRFNAVYLYRTSLHSGTHGESVYKHTGKIAFYWCDFR